MVYLTHYVCASTELNYDIAVPFERLNRNDSVLVILDLQVGLFGLARDFDASLYSTAMLAHASMGKLFDLPVVMSTSAETGPNGPV